MQHAEVQAQRHALEVEAQTQRAAAKTQNQASEFALHARDAVLQANRAIDMLRQLLQPRDQTVDRLTPENTRMQANNGTNHAPTASRPPLLPSPSAPGQSPSQASHVESQGSVASESRHEMRQELRQSRDRMLGAVVTMTQQVGEAMQQQINVLTAQIARSSRGSVEGVVSGTSSHASRAFLPFSASSRTNSGGMLPAGKQTELVQQRAVYLAQQPGHGLAASLRPCIPCAPSPPAIN